jgi:hypothetical protein
MISMKKHESRMQSLVERAFELAPECRNLRELRQRLSSEGYNRLDAHLGGLGTERQLRACFDRSQLARPTRQKDG